MPLRHLNLLQRVTADAVPNKTTKAPHSFYISKDLLEKFKEFLPEGASASAAVEILMEEFVRQAEELQSHNESKRSRSK